MIRHVFNPLMNVVILSMDKPSGSLPWIKNCGH